MPQSIKHTAQAVSTRITLHSATLRLVNVESGINGFLPTSWAPPIYSVSLLTKLRCALPGNGLLRLAAVRSFPRSHLPNAKTNKMMKKSEKTRQGLYNVGFIGMRMAKARRSRSNCLRAEDGPANGGGFIECLVDRDAGFAIIDIFTPRIGMMHDIGGVLEFFGGIAIVVTVSIPSVALSTLLASWCAATTSR